MHQTTSRLWTSLLFLQSAGSGAGAGLFLGLYLIASTVLFAGIPWSKFSHMFFKPAAAFESRVADAIGSWNNLPAPSSQPEVFGGAGEKPLNFLVPLI